MGRQLSFVSLTKNFKQAVLGHMLIVSLFLLSSCSQKGSIDVLDLFKSAVAKINSGSEEGQPSQINISNNNNYVVSGVCSVDNLPIEVKVGSLVKNTTCQNGTWSVSFDLSTLPDGNYDVKVTLFDSNGLPTTEATHQIVKDTIAPAVSSSTIVANAADISLSNANAFVINGSCTEDGARINLVEGSLQIANAICSAGSYTLTANLSGLSDGTHNLSLVHTDVGGNVSNYDFTITKDTVAPDLQITSIANNQTIIQSQLASFNLAGDCETGQTVAVTGDVTANLACVGGHYTSSLDLSALPEGVINLTITQIDSFGNSSIKTISLVKDTQAPSAPSISINAAATHTQSTSVSLGLSAGDDPTEMYITDVAGCGGGGVWETYNTTKAWTLGSSNQNVSVYVKFRDIAENATACISDDIFHDNNPPAAPTSLNDLIAVSSVNTSPVITFTNGTDGESGVLKHQIQVKKMSDDSVIQSWIDFVSGNSVSGLSLNDGVQYKMEFKTIDNAGNESSVVTSDGWYSDLTAPAEPTSLSPGSVPTGNLTPLVTYTPGSDSTSGILGYEMKVQTAGGSDVSGWVSVGLANPAQITSGITLTHGSSYKVLMRAIDNAGNPSGDSIASSTWTAIVQAPPSSLSLTHTARNRSFTVSWSAGAGNGGAGNCKLQYQGVGGAWTDMPSGTTRNCDAAASFTEYFPNSSNWTNAWNGTGVNVRIRRISPDADMGTFTQRATCPSSVGGSGSSTPDYDEDCNGEWNNSTYSPNIVGGCPGGQGCYQMASQAGVGPGCGTCNWDPACNPMNLGGPTCMSGITPGCQGSQDLGFGQYGSNSYTSVGGCSYDAGGSTTYY